MRAFSAASDSIDQCARPVCACFAHSAPRSAPLHFLLHVGVTTLRSHASGFHTRVPQTEHLIVAPLRCSRGIVTAFAAPINAFAQVALHALLRTTCSLVCVMNGLPQCWQAFQNGYTRFAFQCLGNLECFASASFNKDTMVSADDLLAKISDKSVCGIAVFVFNDFKDGLVCVFAMLCIIAQYAITYLGFMVRHHATFCSDFRCFIQAPVDPSDHVADFKPGILDAHGHAVLGAGARKRQQVTARLEHAQALRPNFHAGHVVVPFFTHE